jgi:hypothetical protein
VKPFANTYAVGRVTPGAGARLAAGGVASPSARRDTAGFSLIEIIVTVGLLTFIVLGLVMMFSQTQRAFTTSMAQVDVLETGRAVTDMLARELAEMAPTHLPRATNYFAEMDMTSFSNPLFQELPPGTNRRTNVVQRFFFLSRQKQDWVGTGYYVLPAYDNAGVGALYRYSSTARGFAASLLSSNFWTALATGQISNRVADGIVHLRLRAFDPKGRLITPFVRTNDALAGVTNYWNVVLSDQIDGYYTSNAVPAAVELELGILESGAFERFKAIGSANAVAQRQYLSNHTAQVHIFRQRIPIRNVDPSVYQ